jgi:hypothetical protein
MSAKKRKGKGGEAGQPFASGASAAAAPAPGSQLPSSASREPQFKLDGSAMPVDENGFPVGSSLQRKLDSMRKGAGIPTTAEYEEAQKNPPPPAERRLLLGLACVGLMTVASRASNTMSEILDKDGDSGADEALRNGSYGLLFLNLAGGLGAITFAVRPGAVRWIYEMCDEAAASMGSVLIALALVTMIDPPEIYLQNDGMSLSGFCPHTHLAGSSGVVENRHGNAATYTHQIDRAGAALCDLGRRCLPRGHQKHPGAVNSCW